MKRNLYSLVAALSAAVFVFWGHLTQAYAWLDPITSYIALACLALIIAIDVRAIIRR